MQSDLEKLRPSLQAAIDQGRKIKTLVQMDEWRFFAGWLESAHEELTKAVMSGDFLNDQRREDFNKGVARAFRMLLDTVQEFQLKGDQATLELRRREKLEANEQ